MSSPLTGRSVTVEGYEETEFLFHQWVSNPYEEEVLGAVEDRTGKVSLFPYHHITFDVPMKTLIQAAEDYAMRNLVIVTSDENNEDNGNSSNSGGWVN